MEERVLLAGADFERNPGEFERSMEELEKIIESALENFFGTPLFYFSPSDRTYSVLLHCSEEEGTDLILKIKEHSIEQQAGEITDLNELQKLVQQKKMLQGAVKLHIS